MENLNVVELKQDELQEVDGGMIIFPLFMDDVIFGVIDGYCATGQDLC